MVEGTIFDNAPRHGQEPSHEIMQARIEQILGDTEKRHIIQADFEYTFKQLGLNTEQAHELCEEVFLKLTEGKPLAMLEQESLQRFEQATIQDGKNLVEVLHEKLENRARIIFEQIKLHLIDLSSDDVIDFGAGDGQVTQLLRDELDLLHIEAVDIRDYRAPGVNVPIQIFDGQRVPVPDKAYEAAVLTNVLHHEKDNEHILNELDRIVRNRLVILETVPVGKSEEAMEKDKDRTFMNDYLYNRLFHSANVPVPGTFETPGGWKKRFESHGWKLKSEQDLGFDQPTIKDRHYLLVFERAV